MIMNIKENNIKKEIWFSKEYIKIGKDLRAKNMITKIETKPKIKEKACNQEVGGIANALRKQRMPKISRM